MIQAPNTSNLDVEVTDGAFSLLCVPQDCVAQVWGYLSYLLQKEPALWDRGNSLDSIRNSLDGGTVLAWLLLAKDAKVVMAFMTTVMVYPTCKVLCVVWGAGIRLNDYLELALSGLENYANNQGLDFVSIEGREGWKRPLSGFGYHHIQSTFIKDVSIRRAH